MCVICQQEGGFLLFSQMVHPDCVASLRWERSEEEPNVINVFHEGDEPRYLIDVSTGSAEHNREVADFVIRSLAGLVAIKAALEPLMFPVHPETLLELARLGYTRSTEAGKVGGQTLRKWCRQLCKHQATERPENNAIEHFRSVAIWLDFQEDDRLDDLPNVQAIFDVHQLVMAYGVETVAGIESDIQQGWASASKWNAFVTKYQVNWPTYNGAAIDV